MLSVVRSVFSRRALIEKDRSDAILLVALIPQFFGQLGDYRIAFTASIAF